MANAFQSVWQWLRSANEMYGTLDAEEVLVRDIRSAGVKINDAEGTFKMDHKITKFITKQLEKKKCTFMIEKA